MDRKVQWAVIGLLAFALAWVAIATRYEYVHQAGAQIRIDRWTGTLQRWGCVEAARNADGSINFERELRVLRGESLRLGDCAREGWR